MATKALQATETVAKTVSSATVVSHATRRRFGKKQIFLPNFTLTMIRNPKLPPTFASFIVPLNMNKLDLRDYLWNAYGIPVIGVRSYIQLQKLRQDKPGVKRPLPRKWFRPRSIKKMTVEMESPFTWPEEPTVEELEKWDHSMYKAANEDRREVEEEHQPGHKQKAPTKTREAFKEQAQSFLSGREKWTPTPRLDEWVDVGEEREVETDIKLPESRQTNT